MAAQYFRIVGPVPTAITDVSADGIVTWTNQPTNAVFTLKSARTLDAGCSWLDWIRVPASNSVTAHRVFDPNPPLGMAFIPGGLFVMGDAFSEWAGEELPLHSVYVSAFHMDTREVTRELWEDVKAWASEHGYAFSQYSGGGWSSSHPAQTLSWYDCVLWCNARSEKESLTPCYYTDAGQGTVYRAGALNISNDCVKWNANGYRLPTEAEWEKAARGGVEGRRFPWSETLLITHALANYNSTTNYAYDTSPTLGFHPDYGVPVCTSPVGTFPANGYGLHDMAGNVWEWCWDWYTRYDAASVTNPRGNESGAYRMLRGGAWNSEAVACRVAHRYNTRPNASLSSYGFRTVRTAAD